MTAMLTTTEVESFAKFSNFKLYSDDDSGTIRTKPYQVIVPVGATIDLDQEHADKARAPDPSSSSEAHFTQSRGPGGSVISENTIRQRFIETTPKYMRCTDRLSFGHSLEPKRNALGCRYLNPNSQKVVRWQFFDLDRSDAALRFDDANVAVPNAIIENEENGHAHYAYALEVGVVRSADGRTAPQNYLEAIRRGMTRRLGADPHFGHYLAKNPLHPQWRTTWLSTKAHSLNDMSVWLEAEDMRPAHKSRKAEHEFAQEGRNCSLTSDLAKFALRVAWRFKHGAHTLQDYQRGLHVEAFNLNEAFPEPLPFKEVQAIVRSVGKWAWAHSTAEKFSEMQRWRAEARRRRALGIISGLESFGQMSSAELADSLGRSERTARRYIAENRTRPMSERKTEPWQTLGISRRTYYRRKSAA